VNRRHRAVSRLIVFASLLGIGARARADVTLAAAAETSPNGWEVYTTGRVGAFVQVLQGDGIPQAFATQVDPTTGMPVLDMNGNPVIVPIHTIGDGGVRAGLADPRLDPNGSSGQGHLGVSRVGSGFLPNILGVGLRKQLTQTVKVDTFISMWASAGSNNRRTFHANNPDVREAYARFEAPWGSLLVGRALSLFSRGEVEIDFLYGHGYGVGNPGGFDDQGPSAGHIGYGIIAPVFVAGVVYATPKFHGLQLTAGYYDPATTVGIYWGRTKYGRAEGEATYDLTSGAFKLHLFVSGAWQKIYSLNLLQDPVTGQNFDIRPSADVLGGAGGARAEIGRLHLGVATHQGRGLGVGYFLDGSDANFAKDTTHELRMFHGVYTQGQVVAGKFDLNAGWGITWIDPIDADSNPNWCGAGTVAMPCSGYSGQSGVLRPASSILKSQMGISGVVVYHLTPSVHFAADYFFSDVKWQQGEKQIVNAYSLGTTITW
jgi:predicted porin